ncbi:MAG TPA: S41 family peptidase, partial [Kofleriaceae bacterium]
SIVATLKERQSERFAQVTMEVDAAEPHRVVHFVIHPIPTPEELLGPKVPPAAAFGDGSAAASPPAKQFAAWLTAFNAGDRDGLVAYHTQHFPYEVASDDVHGIDRELGLSTGTGGFELKKAEYPTPTHIVATLKERHSSQFARAEMEVAAAEPHGVVRFEIHPIPTPDELMSPEERKATAIDDAKRRAVIDGIAKELDAHYVTPAVGTKMIAALRDHLARGDYDKIAQGPAFALALTKDLRDVSHDLHLGVMFGPGPSGPPPSSSDQAAMLKGMNYGFGPIERMSGNVAHVVINGFPQISDDASREGVANLMSQAADADALILDLRTNHGGWPETVALIASYLFDSTPVHLNDMWDRDTGKIEPSWTVKDLRGKRFGAKKPVYVLTSKGTFSGGEEMAYDLQSLHRAKTVGETTGGGAHPVGPHPVGDFVVMVPSGRPINPVTKTDWEGVGVVPDIKVAADAALEEAHRRALADIAAAKKAPARP